MTWRSRRVRHAVAAVLIVWSLLVAGELGANELVVDAQRIGAADILTFTVALEGAFAARDAVDVPLQNLALVGEPSVSSEFSWINGRISRRKSFRYRARPLSAGVAQVGPIVLEVRNERRVLPAVRVEVVSDRVTPTNRPEAILRDLIGRGRPPLFLIAEADRTTAVPGEQIVVTWYVYNAATIQQWQVVESPSMPEFWVEEIQTRSNQADTVWVGATAMQRMIVRRVALYPLRSGTFEIGGTTIEAAVLQGSRPGPFSIFEGRLVDVTHSSAPVTIQVRPIPDGPPVDAVGELSLRCDSPVQQGGGPVVIPVALTGQGNLRAAVAPRFEGELPGQLQIEGGETSLIRGDASASMNRRWRYLIFPARSGLVEIPPLTMRIFDPAAGARRELRCNATTIQVTSADLPQSPEPDVPAGALPRRRNWPAILGVLLIAGAIGWSVPRLRRRLAARRLVKEILQSGTAAGVLERVEGHLGVGGQALMAEHSDRGDAYRALRSLLDAADHDRDISIGAEREIERRVRDVIAFRASSR